MILSTGTPVRPFCGMVESLYKHQYLLLLLLYTYYNPVKNTMTSDAEQLIGHGQRELID